MITPGDKVFYKECKEGNQFFTVLEIVGDRALCLNCNPKLTVQLWIPLCSLKLAEDGNDE